MSVQLKKVATEATRGCFFFDSLQIASGCIQILVSLSHPCPPPMVRGQHMAWVLESDSCPWGMSGFLRQRITVYQDHHS